MIFENRSGFSEKTGKKAQKTKRKDLVPVNEEERRKKKEIEEFKMAVKRIEKESASYVIHKKKIRARSANPNATLTKNIKEEHAHPNGAVHHKSNKEGNLKEKWDSEEGNRANRENKGKRTSWSKNPKENTQSSFDGPSPTLETFRSRKRSAFRVTEKQRFLIEDHKTEKWILKRGKIGKSKERPEDNQSENETEKKMKENLEVFKERFQMTPRSFYKNAMSL